MKISKSITSKSITWWIVSYYTYQVCSNVLLTHGRIFTYVVNIIAVLYMYSFVYWNKSLSSVAFSLLHPTFMIFNSTPILEYVSGLKIPYNYSTSLCLHIFRIVTIVYKLYYMYHFRLWIVCFMHSTAWVLHWNPIAMTRQ